MTPAEPANDQRNPDPGPASTAEVAIGVAEDVLSPTAPGPPEEVAVLRDLPPVAFWGAGRWPVALVATCVASGATFAALSVWVAVQGAQPAAVDSAVHGWVVAHRSAGSLVLARAVTWGGVTAFAIPALVVVGATALKAGSSYARRIRAGVLLSGAAGLGVFLGLRVNAVVGRARPSMADWAGAAGGPSFPSGHTTVATIFATFCAWALADRLPAGWPRRLLWATAAVYAAAVGFSRVWLGVHWPTDVLGGWFFGVTWFTGVTLVVGWRRQRAHRS